MKTKTLILTALVALAGSVSVKAQVYSLNVVGYVNTTIRPGFNLVCNPLKAGTNHLDSIMSGVVDGTTVYRYRNGTYADTIQYYQSPEFTGWFSADPNETYTILPGEGFFVYNPTTTNLVNTFVGEVVTGTRTNDIPNGFSIQASQVPQALPIGNASTTNTLNFPSADGDVLYIYDSVAKTYKDTYQYYASPEFTGWFSANVDDPGPNGPTIGVGQSFFVLKAGTAKWVRTFNIN